MRLVLLLCLVLTACTAAPAAPTPAPAPSSTGRPATPDEPLEPLHGVPLTGPTGLRLLVGDTVLDVDDGGQHQVAGLPDVPDDEVVIDAVGRDAVLTVTKPRLETYVLRHGAAKATRIATGVHVTPGLGGVWAKTYGETCTLGKLGLTGQVLLPARPIDCAIEPRLETREGLHVGLGPPDPGAVLDPRTLRQRASADQTVAAGVRWDGDQRLVVGTRRYSIPESIRYGRPDVTEGPDRRHLALEYGHPAWPGPRQRLDVWVLDTDTGSWTHLPSMPVAAALKVTDLTWTDDGRLVLLGEFDGIGTALATWRPGDRQLAIRPTNVSSSHVITL